MAIDKRLKIYDDQGHDVDYDIMADDVKFLPDGKDLPTKLAEMEEEIGEGGYTPPAGGIPKTDLAQSVQTSLGLADTALQEADKIQLQAAINAVQTALNNLIGGNVQDAIDTFNEVVSFLNGIDTSDPTLKNQLLALNNAITNLGNSLAAVATSGSYNDLSNKPTILSQQQVAGMIEDAIEDLPTGDIPTKVSDLENDEGYIKASQMDNAPTAGSNNPVKSGGIKTALDGKANVADVPTNQDMADAIDDALGEAQVTVVPASSVGIISSLGSDSDSDALSAAMGKKLKVALITILSNLGEYAFPNGKPTIDWGGDSSVTYSVTYPDASATKVTHGNAPATVNLGDQLDVTLGTNDDLYVVKDSSVKVYMGGVEQSGAYDSATQKVTLAAVTGNVVIVAEAWTYVSRGLVMHLDGRNRGGTAGKWKSLVDYNSSPLYFKLENCDEQSDYVAGNGTNSKGTAFSNSALTTAVTLLDVGADAGTIEAAYSHAEISSAGTLPIMHNGSGNKICLMSWHPSAFADSDNTFVMNTSPGLGAAGTSQRYAKSVINSGGYVSFELGSFMFNGESLSTNDNGFATATEESKLSLFYRRTSSDTFGKLRLYALRVYSVQLTNVERAQNLAIDQKRFNLA